MSYGFKKSPEMQCCADTHGHGRAIECTQMAKYGERYCSYHLKMKEGLIAPIIAPILPASCITVVDRFTDDIIHTGLKRERKKR